MWLINLFLSLSRLTCNSSIQYPLKYNLSHRPIPDGLPIYNPNESLANAICCDTDYLGFAEPRFLFNESSVNLFSKLDGVTTFYDSTCGIPLFKTPINRTIEDFKRETLEHGWPSFSPEEVIDDNVIINNKSVSSRCGTHLGDYMEILGNWRYCIDLICISGN